MLMIRLQRTGRRNEPHFRIVVTEKTTSPKGKYLEAVGFVSPREKRKSVNKERVLYWMSKGAKPSATVTNVLVSEKIIDVPKIPKHHLPKKAKGAEQKPTEVPMPEQKVTETPAAPPAS